MIFLSHHFFALSSACLSVSHFIPGISRYLPIDTSSCSSSSKCTSYHTLNGSHLFPFLSLIVLLPLHYHKPNMILTISLISPTYQNGNIRQPLLFLYYRRLLIRLSLWTPSIRLLHYLFCRSSYYIAHLASTLLISLLSFSTPSTHSLLSTRFRTSFIIHPYHTSFCRRRPHKTPLCLILYDTVNVSATVSSLTRPSYFFLSCLFRHFNLIAHLPLLLPLLSFHISSI